MTYFESLGFCHRFLLSLFPHSTFSLPMLVVWFGWFLGTVPTQEKYASPQNRSAASRQNLRRDIELRPEPGPRTKTTNTNGAASPLLKGKRRAGWLARPSQTQRTTALSTLQDKATRLAAFGDFLLQRYRAKCLSDLPRGPQEDYRAQARRLGIPAYGLPLRDRSVSA